MRYRKRHTQQSVSFSGAGDGTRTRNLLITNQLLCQLSYTSTKAILAYFAGNVNSFLVKIKLWVGCSNGYPLA